MLNLPEIRRSFQSENMGLEFDFQSTEARYAIFYCAIFLIVAFGARWLGEKMGGEKRLMEIEERREKSY